MSSFYDITTKIREHLIANSQVNTVTEGDIFDVDLNKQTIFPLSHIMINNVTFNDIGITYSMSILFMDVADVSKDDPRDETEIFYGVDNRHDILNTQLLVANDLVSHLKRGDLMQDKYQLNGTPSCEPFEDRFENLLVGWNLTLSIDIANTITTCL